MIVTRETSLELSVGVTMQMHLLAEGNKSLHPPMQMQLVGCRWQRSDLANLVRLFMAHRGFTMRMHICSSSKEEAACMHADHRRHNWTVHAQNIHNTHTNITLTGDIPSQSRQSFHCEWGLQFSTGITMQVQMLLRAKGAFELLCSCR